MRYALVKGSDSPVEPALFLEEDDMQEEASHSVRRTPKAVLTRQRILDTALHLFAINGYEGTSMRGIAAAAECSLGLTYRYFAHKEDLVLELYVWLVVQLEEQVRLLPAAPIAGRFQQLMRGLLKVMEPHRLTLVALSGAALNPFSRAGVFGMEGAEVRRRARAAYLILVAEAKDEPRAAQVDAFATLLYGVQLALVLFWLQDLSHETHKTEELLGFIHDVFERLRHLLRLPWAAQALARLVEIIGPMLGREGAAPDV
jgi:AcrR family transcriptional regulator